MNTAATSEAPPTPATTLATALASELAKSFDPHAIESCWYPRWEAAGYFKQSADAAKTPYCIQLPPPNVTGTLHMGHAFQHTLQDALIRYHRMRGFDTLWQMGRVPVTFGGGSKIVYGVPLPLGLKQPLASHCAYQRVSKS